MTVLAAVDLGASSGRVMAARVDGDRIDLTEAARFPNRSVMAHGRLYWDVLGLWSGVLEGLRAVGPVAAIGVDSWAVDYGLIDERGHLVGNPVCYRDARGAAGKDRLLTEVDAVDLFARTGVQHQPFNTVFQLAAEDPAALERAERLLLIPDLFGYWLSGVVACEATNASTTGLVDQGTGTWRHELCSAAGFRADLLGTITPTGTVLGGLLPEVAAATGLPEITRVVATASHDTAAAVAAVPYEHDRAAYISCGTWSLVGVERDRPITTAAALDAGFTNERGADGSIRFLRNVAGLWLLNESVATWRAQGLDVELGDLLDQAAKIEPLRSVVDPDDPRFAEPGDMPARIRDYCSETGQPVPEGPAEVARCVLDSLALAHRRAVAALEALTGDPVEIVHIVGGGANNQLLCQLTADATGRTVLAGPDEATALGNALVQAQALGLMPPGAAARRAAARASARPRRHTPQGPRGPWEQAAPPPVPVHGQGPRPTA
ncbi:rhamnulokinase [Glycomyces sp. TRM65418]|uniref:rhamnulokinase n=1 Tax=Glycomyces sp. TRM65418 TaxID=2867006 RepID=UPI001CE644D1|nr:rhamnulokinase family protein [Glycomyces sp. TRM65418]MCC3763196.1 rhamnulokinase [Glycomyces sp. TRM65418]QZD57200.1 rhamnulokinase [Glycomyces sp. TRM65418]